MLLFDAENDTGAVTIPRLVANGANLNNIALLTFSEGEDALAAFEQKIKDAGGRIKLVLIDHHAAFLHELGANDNDPAAAKRVLKELHRIAAEHQLAIVVVGHTDRSGRSLISGASVYENVRMIHRVEFRDDGTRLLSPAKDNIGDAAAALQFTEEQVSDTEAEHLLQLPAFADVRTDDDPATLPTIRKRLKRVRWMEPVPLIGDTARPKAGIRASRIEACSALLRELVKDGPRRSPEVLTECEARGYSKNDVTDASVKLGSSFLTSKISHVYFKGFGPVEGWPETIRRREAAAAAARNQDAGSRS